MMSIYKQNIVYYTGDWWKAFVEKTMPPDVNQDVVPKGKNSLILTPIGKEGIETYSTCGG